MGTWLVLQGKLYLFGSNLVGKNFYISHFCVHFIVLLLKKYIALSKGMHTFSHASKTAQQVWKII